MHKYRIGASEHRDSVLGRPSWNVNCAVQGRWARFCNQSIHKVSLTVHYGPGVLGTPPLLTGGRDPRGEPPANTATPYFTDAATPSEVCGLHFQRGCETDRAVGHRRLPEVRGEGCRSPFLNNKLFLQNRASREGKEAKISVLVNLTARC